MLSIIALAVVTKRNNPAKGPQPEMVAENSATGGEAVNLSTSDAVNSDVRAASTSNLVQGRDQDDAPPPPPPPPSEAEESQATERGSTKSLLEEPGSATENQAIIVALQTGRDQTFGRGDLVRVDDVPQENQHLCRTYSVTKDGEQSSWSTICQADDGRWSLSGG